MKRAPLFIAWMTLWCVVAFSQQPQRLTADQEQAVRVRYPQVWERKIAEGTKVAVVDLVAVLRRVVVLYGGSSLTLRQ